MVKRRKSRAIMIFGAGFSVASLAWYWIDHVYIVLLTIESLSIFGFEPPFLVMSMIGLATLAALAALLGVWIANATAGED